MHLLSLGSLLKLELPLSDIGKLSDLRAQKEIESFPEIPKGDSTAVGFSPAITTGMPQFFL